jgi:protein-tyrosine phosphatase
VDGDPLAPRFRVLVVCTANRYRSPLGEHLLRHACDPSWEITSAGVRAEEGAALDPAVGALLADRGITVSGWRSSQLTPQRIGAADLILAADESHRRAVVTLEPAALGRTYLLLQFARLAQAAPPGADGSRLLERANSARPRLQPIDVGRDEVQDPAGRARRALRSCAEQIDTAAKAIGAGTP